MDTIQEKKPRSGGAKVLFIIACVFFVIAAIVNIFWPLVWFDVLASVLRGESTAEEVLGQIISIILFFPIWLITSPISALISIVLSAFCIKHTKIAIILLVVISVLLILNVASVTVLFSANSSQSAMLSPLFIG